MIVWISKFNKQTHDNQDKQNTEILYFNFCELDWTCFAVADHDMCFVIWGTTLQKI